MYVTYIFFLHSIIILKNISYTKRFFIFLVVVWTSWNNNNNIKITLPRSIFWYYISKKKKMCCPNCACFGSVRKKFLSRFCNYSEFELLFPKF